jgi:hypothetical protein
MKKVLVFAAALMLCAIVFAQGPEKTIQAMVSWKEGAYQITDASVVIDYKTENNPNGNFLAKLADSQGQTLFQIKAAKPSPSEPSWGDSNIEMTGQFYNEQENKGFMVIYLPYLEDAKYVSFEHGTAILAKADLSVLCNSDGKCDSSENFLSCEKDCPLDNADGYCLAESEGICDPDCAEGLDPDCTQAGGQAGTQAEASPMFVLVMLVAAVFALIAFYFMQKKKKK